MLKNAPTLFLFLFQYINRPLLPNLEVRANSFTRNEVKT